MTLSSNTSEVSEFDSYAGDYDLALNQGLSVSGEDKTFFAEQRILWLARRLEELAIRPRAVLDYGCGTGTAAPYLVEILGAEHVIGVDISAKSLEVARQNNIGLPVEYALIDDARPNGEIDVAFCNGVFHHIPRNGRAAAARYIAQWLRPNGVFAMWENNPWSPAARYVMSRIPFDRDAVMLWPGEARELVRSAGLSVARTDFAFIFPRVLRFLRFAEPSMCRLPLGAQYQVLARKVDER